MSNSDTIGVRAWVLKLAASIAASTNEAKGSVQSRIDPFALFACKSADDCDNSYFKNCVISIGIS